MPAGDVIAQSPIAGISVPPGTSVDLVVSSGPVMVDVPDVVGDAQATAEATINAVDGLSVGAVSTENHATVPAGDVISQAPVGGSSVVYGSTVDLVVSMGPAPVPVPPCVGLTRTAAEAAITAAGLSIGTVTEENSDTVAAGLVISQDPVDGTNVASGSPVDLWVSLGPVPTDLVADAGFDASVDSADLIANGSGQDWYESRNDVPTLLSLNTDNIGGNATKKAALLNNGIANNAYLTQELLAPQSDTFAVSFEMYIDSMANAANYRTGFIFIGDDTTLTNPPNGTSSERFVYLTFYDPSPGDTGDDLEIRAREKNTPAQPYAETNTWTSVASGLSYDTWYTVEVVVDVTGGTYDVYVDGMLVGDDISKYEQYGSTPLTHISYAVMNDAQGNVYVDNVTETTLVRVPNCEDVVQASAETLITGAGLTVGVVATDFHATIPAGNVISTTPAADTEVPVLASVDLLVSDGPAPVPVPPCVGLTRTAAEAAITAAGLSIGTVTEENSDTVAAGLVISQDPVDGTNVASGSPVDLWVSLGPVPTDLVADAGFDASVDSADLIANGSGQDWYESRNDVPTLLSLNTDNIGGNATKKAALLNNGIANNAYLTQELLAPQSDTFAVSFEMYIDSMANAANYRTGFIFIGDDTTLTNPPNGTSSERFVYLTFYDPYPGDTGDDLEIRAREKNTPAQPYAETNTWTSVASGLSYDTWYTVEVVVDVTGGTYDVYVDGMLVGDDISKYEQYGSTPLTHISYAVMNDAQGNVYVDNVAETTLVRVPNCEDVVQASAETLITGAGLTVGVVATDFHATIPAGNVISTTPAADTEVPVLASVDLLVSDGPAPVPVPPCVGLTRTAAEAAITAAGLSIGTVTEENSDTVAAGLVISQDPVDGTNVASGSPVDLWVSLGPVPTDLVADAGFDASVDSADLIANGSGQDWYESRNDVPTLLSLNTDNIGGNATKKAALLNNGIANNAYLTQELLAPQSDTFAVSFEMYIDSMANAANYRTGFIFIGDDTTLTNPPNGTSSERFVYLTFYDPSPGDTGDDLEIRAREKNTPAQPYAETNTWTSVASGLSYDTWYTVEVVVDVTGGTYDVYVDGMLVGDDISKYEQYGSTPLTHISYAVMNDAQGNVYVDNVASDASPDFDIVPEAMRFHSSRCRSSYYCGWSDGWYRHGSV